jgi:PBP1b-binding outer membrane lipoprotein LpoB
MSKHIIGIFLLPLILFSAGCSKYWYQEGKSFDECKQARAECFEELKKRTDFSNPTADYEIKFMNECMQSKGFQEVSAKELPLDVRREEPETSLHWRTRGLAGSVK